MEPNALTGSMSLTPLTEIRVCGGAGAALATVVTGGIIGRVAGGAGVVFTVSAGLDCAATEAVPPAELASPRVYTGTGNSKMATRMKPAPKKRQGFAGDSRKPPSKDPGENTVRVSQLSPVLGASGRPDDEGDMRMGCGWEKQGMEGERKRMGMSAGQSGLRSR